MSVSPELEQAIERFRKEADQVRFEIVPAFLAGGGHSNSSSNRTPAERRTTLIRARQTRICYYPSLRLQEHAPPGEAVRGANRQLVGLGDRRWT